ncbi:MAG: polysaccharide pyruvyl transferase CsaB [Clostridiales bacterium]|nr:polysaccharide pyruvyl transferase CsaB [Clostridiales bacterium]
MKVIHLIGGGDIGGAKVHVLSLVKQLNKEISVKIISFRPGIFADEARELGLDVKVIRNNSLLKDIRQTISIIKNETADIIHCHGAKGNIIGYFCKKATKLPIMTTIHSDYKLDYLHSFFKAITIGKLNALALRKMDAHVAVTNHFRQMMISRKFNANRVYTVCNGLDFSVSNKIYYKKTFLKNNHIPYNEKTIYVGIVARLSRVKNIDTLINAASIIRKTHTEIIFIIAGEGEESRELKKLSISLGLSASLYFVGWVNDPYEVMNVLDISVLTSISEGFPYSVLEGAMCKKASISTNVGGIPDLFDHGENGFLFNPGDVKSLVSHLITLIENPLLRMQFGNKLYKKAVTEFSLEKMATLQLHAYHDILSWFKKGKHSYDVIMSGYYGFMNIGDDALLDSIINNLKHIKKDIKILILSRNPVETTKINGVDSISRFNLFQIINMMKRSSLFVYGGGTLIQESTSTKSLLYYLGTLYLAKLFGQKTMLYANGVKLLHKKFNIFVTKAVLNKIDLITLRENQSLVQLKKLGITKPKITITADPAVTTYPCSDTRAKEILKKEGVLFSNPLIGICVREWKGYEKKCSREIASFADTLYEKHGYIPVFIPMQQKYIDDSIISLQISQLMKSPSYILSEYYSAEEVMGVIKQLDLLLGMRLHSLIFATCCEVPSIAIEYEPKVSGFMDYIQLSSLVAGNVKEVSSKDLIKVFNYISKNKDTIKRQLGKQTAIMRVKAIENASLAINLMNQKGEKGES